MFGGARNGYCSIERPRITTTPIRSVKIEITMATIGRLMKKLDMVSFPWAWLVNHRLTDSLDCRVLPFAFPHDDALAWVETVEHDNVLLRFVSELDGPHRHHVLRVDDHHCLGAL